MVVPEPHPPFHEERMVAGAAEQIFADINRFFSKAHVQRAAMQDERTRLARELHDGVLQSLTGAALQLEALSRLLEGNPHVQKRLCEIEQVITGEHRALRAWIENLKSKTATPSMMSYTDLASALEK